MFDSAPKLLLGLLTGFLFGFVLQKGRVAKFEVITGQLLLRDWTVARIMITAIAVGSIGVYTLVSTGVAGLHLKPALLGGVVVGGILFGAGMAVPGVRWLDLSVTQGRLASRRLPKRHLGPGSQPMPQQSSCFVFCSTTAPR
jgi:hypothetical protein